MDLHFVYAGSPFEDKKYSPFTITQNLYKFFDTKFDKIHYYDWYHQDPVQKVKKDDIIIGHPNYSPQTALRQLFEYDCKAKFMLWPFHHSFTYINMPFDDLVAKADKIFTITGPYWFDTMDQTPFAHWKPKAIRVDMAIDSSYFKFYKKKFNPVGERTFAYIGCDRPEKGLDILQAIFAKTPHKLHVYGNVDGGNGLLKLENVIYHGWVDINQSWMKDFANQCDCFINTSRSDANPTTLLESAAIGLVTACTIESGYYSNLHPESDGVFWQVNPGDIDGTIGMMNHLNTVPQSDLLAHTKAARKVIESKYNWDNFCNTIWDEVKKYL